MSIGPFVNFLKSPDLRESSVLDDVGGYEKVDGVDVVSATENNKLRQVVSDIISDQWQELDVRWFSLTTIDDGVADAKAAIDLAVAYAIANGRAIEFRGNGTYRVSAAVIIESADGLRIVSRSGATVLFPSADTSLTDSTPGYDSSLVNARSGMYIRNSDNVTIEGLSFLGNSTETDKTINYGSAVSVHNCAYFKMIGCHQSWGGGLVTQTGLTNDYGAVVSECSSYASRNNSRLAGIFVGCHFKLPTDASFDGSTASHGIYWYAASASHCGAIGCKFENIRLQPVKVSGSSSAMSNYFVRDCTMVNCGAVLMGADDVNSHVLLSVTGLTCHDPVGGAVQILGGTGVTVSDINVHFSAAPAELGPVVSVYRYTSSSQPVESVIIEKINIHAPPHVGASTIASYGVFVQGVGNGAYKVGSLIIRDILVSYAADIAVFVDTCVCPDISGIKSLGCTYALKLTNNRRPVVDNVRDIERPNNTATIRLDGNTWPKITGYSGGGRTNGTTAIGYTGKAQIADAAGSSATGHPLLGSSGCVSATGGKPEIVFAYGSGWTAAGTSNIGRCSNDPADTTGTITLITTKDAVNFPVGTKFFASANSNGSSPRTGTATVTATDPSAGTVTFSGTITGITTNDYLFTAADTIDFNGTTLTYVSSAPGANQFSSQATLITAINALGGGTVYAAADYGGDYASPWATSVGHIRVRRQSTSTTANLFYIKPSTRSPLACDILVNYAVGQDRCYSRGENVAATVWAINTSYTRGQVVSNGGNLYLCIVAGTSAGAGGPTTTAQDITDNTAQWRYLGAGANENGVVIWSPHVKHEAPPVLVADNAAARGAVAMCPPLRIVTEAGDDQACCVYRVPGMNGTEQFTWRL